jgi:hypothetical protein
VEEWEVPGSLGRTRGAALVLLLALLSLAWLLLAIATCTLSFLLRGELSCSNRWWNCDPYRPIGEPTYEADSNVTFLMAALAPGHK